MEREREKGREGCEKEQERVRKSVSVEMECVS